MGLKVKVKQKEVEKDSNDRWSDLGSSFELPEDVNFLTDRLENTTTVETNKNNEEELKCTQCQGLNKKERV